MSEALPDLSGYAHHRTDTDASFEGRPVQGLTAEFYRRPDGDRVASVGRYSYRGRVVFMAWGYVDEQHCRHTAVRDPAGGWCPATVGCPVGRVGPGGDLLIQTPGGAWISAGRVSASVQQDQPVRRPGVPAGGRRRRTPRSG